MALTLQDKEWVQLTTKELVREVTLELLKAHEVSCPIGQAFARNKAFITGVIIGVGLFCGSAGYGVARLLQGIQ